MIKKMLASVVLLGCVFGGASAHDNTNETVGDWAISQCLSIKKQMIETKDIALGLEDKDWKKWLEVTEKNFRIKTGESGQLFTLYKDIVEEACG